MGGIGRTNTGGGANLLNFTVKTYPSEVELKADKPKENTIGVITTTTMTSWVFSAKEPTEPEAGMVWINVGTLSNCEFNALKNNTLQVYPLSSKQYVGGAFADIVSYSYQGEEWVEWATYVLNLVDSFTTVRESGTGSIAIDNGTVTAKTTGTGSDSQGAVMYFSDKTIDLSEYKTLSFHVKNSGKKYTSIGFYSANTDKYLWNNKVAVHEIYDSSSIDYEQNVTVDVSNVNSQCYFAIGMAGYVNGAGTNTAVVSDIKLLK